MLQPNPKVRWSASKLLTHDFVKKFNTDFQITEPKPMTQNVKRFMMASAFEKLVVSMLAGLNASKEELEQLQNSFAAIDKNNDGTLSHEELQ